MGPIFDDLNVIFDDPDVTFDGINLAISPPPPVPDTTPDYDRRRKK